MAAPLEDQAKALLRGFGIATPAGTSFESFDDLVGGIDDIEYPVVAKALVPIGRKGNAGAVVVCRDHATLIDTFPRLATMDVHSFASKGVYVESFVAIAREYFLSIAFDTLTRSPAIMLSAHGGVDVEASVSAGAQTLIRLDADLRSPVDLDAVAAAWKRAGAPDGDIEALAHVTVAAWRAYVELDCRVLEINPVAITDTGAAVAAGVLVDLDDNSLFRHEDISLGDEGRFGRSPTPREKRLLEAQARSPRGSIRFMELPDGEFINLVSGGGCSLLSTDQMFDAGVRPATYFDATGPSDELWRAVFEECLTIPDMTGLIFGSNVASIAPVARRMELLVEALDKLGVEAGDAFPVVVRLAGSGQETARATAAEKPGITFFGYEVTIEQAVDHFLDRIRRPVPQRGD